jgi:glycosidase
VVRRWCDPNGDGDPSDGVDGFRVAPERVGRGFWRELRRWVLGINPGALLAGELLWQDPGAGKMWNPGPWLRGDQLDTVMNYRLADVAKAFFIDRQGAITAADFDARLAALRAEERPETGLALMSVLDSGRTDRLASQVVNPDRPYDQKRSPADDPKYDVRAPRVEEWKRLRLLAAFQFAYVGTPLVYYGTEAGMWGADDPDCRKPMVWKELRYQDEGAAPPSLTRHADPVRLDDDLLKYYQLLGRARADAPALRRGSFETVLADDARRLFAFVRVEEDRVVAAFNAGGRDLTVDLPFAGPAARDLLSARRYRSKDGKVSVVIPAFGAVLLAADNR